MDAFYPRLGVTSQDRPCTVLRTAIRALHPGLAAHARIARRTPALLSHHAGQSREAAG